MINKGLVGLTIFIVGLSACQNKKPDIITYDLTRKDFSEKIYGIGTFQSANNYTITAPRVYSIMLKVVKLLPEGSMAEVGDTVCVLEANDISSFYDQYAKELEQVNADLIKQEANNNLQLSELDAQLKENDLKTEFSRLDSIQIKFAPAVKQQILELELKKNQILQQKILKKLEAQKKINEQSIRALKSQIIQKEQLVQRFQEQLDMLTIIAAKPGMVVYANSPLVMVMMGDGTGGSTSGGKTKVGASVMMDMALVELPDLDSMQIEMVMQEAEYKRVEKGQKVLIKPESIDGLQTTGTVKSKSLASERLDNKFNVKSYKIIIDVDSLDSRVLPGLSANCELIIRNVRDTVVVPDISIFEKDSLKKVYVLKDNFFEAISIETGLTNGSETIVSKGLRGSETIALMEPPYNYILKPKNSGDE